jgi:hypothetical protein
MNTQQQQYNVLHFVGNLDLNTETLKALLIAEQIGELLRVDCFADEKRKIYTYIVYFADLFQNSFTHHILTYLEEGRKYEMTFEWNGIPGNYFYISLFNTSRYATNTLRRFCDEYQQLDQQLDQLLDQQEHNTNPIPKSKFTLLKPMESSESKMTTFLNIHMQNYEKLKKVLEETTSGKGMKRYIQITINEPFEIECTQYMYDVIMANIDKDEDEEWSWDV